MAEHLILAKMQTLALVTNKNESRDNCDPEELQRERSQLQMQPRRFPLSSRDGGRIPDTPSVTTI